MSKTNFDLVRAFHETFQHPINGKPYPQLFEEQKQLVDLRLKLIKEEVSELEDAIKNKDIIEVADALSDILYVVYGAGHALGINLDNTFKLVHESNMTKACSTEQEAIDTVEHIKKEGRYKNPAYKQSADKKYWIVYDADTGKILKSKYYKPVNLAHVKG
jgi:predicted HAD superfamily Cof-like phosphohydrolase